MNENAKAGASAPAGFDGATFLDEGAVKRIFPLIAARFEFYRLQYQETSNPLLVWRVVWEYFALGRRTGLPVSFPPWCGAYLEQTGFALGQLAAPAGLDGLAPAVPPQKARAAVAEALGLVARGRSHFHASAREMIETDIGNRASRLREQGFSETQAVEALAIFYEKDERTIRGHVAAFRKKLRKIERLSQAARREHAKT